jgi:hypothetical protein
MGENLNKVRIYLDDVRTPVDKDWLVVRNFHEFVNLVNKVGMTNISLISLDHDLGDTAMQEYFNNVSKNYKLDYDNIEEKTGYDAAKWLVNEFYDKYPKRLTMSRFDKKQIPVRFPEVVVHSANPIGSANIMGYINNFLMNEGQDQTCVRVKIEHTV